MISPMNDSMCALSSKFQLILTLSAHYALQIRNKASIMSETELAIFVYKQFTENVRSFIRLWTRKISNLKILIQMFTCDVEMALIALIK